jgi:mRNA degradation ribonuclease J1/J2
MDKQQGTNVSNRPSWLVWAKGSQSKLDPLLERFQQDDETEIVKTLGPPDMPHTLVVMMSDETAHRYQEEFQDEFGFELNAPLELQGNSS